MSYQRIRKQMIAVMLIVLFLAGCGTSAPETSEIIANKAEDIVGIWTTQFMGTEAYIQFNADETFDLARTIDALESSKILSGTFWFEGTVFNMKDNLGIGTGTYEVRVQKEGDKSVKLSFTVIDDTDSDRVKDLTEEMARVEP